jgi:hypothetical protein
MASNKKKNIAKHIIFLIVLTILYLGILAYFQPKVFSYRFNKSLIDRYFCSQDITTEPPCKRLFLSDSDLHIAAGYLYINGTDPTAYHFQHTPFIKYLYGLTIILTKNPFYLEIIFGIIYLCLAYILAYKVFKSMIVAAGTSALLLIDPLFLMLSGDASFEMGQACFLLAYTLAVLYKKDNFILQGLFLGLFASSKFWGAVPFFVMALNGFNFIKKRTNIKIFLLQLFVGFVVFSLTYLKTFINKGGFFNIFFFQLKLLKYWKDHSVANVPFSSISLFLAGFYKSWWGDQSIIKADVWSFFWPLTFLSSIFKVMKNFQKKLIDNNLLIAAIPVMYLVYLAIQAPFPRYFILILPFLYMIFIKFVFDLKKSF